MNFERYLELQTKYGHNFICGYARDPTFKSGEGKDYVNAICVLDRTKGFICTRRLPYKMIDCPVYLEAERQMKMEMQREAKR